MNALTAHPTRKATLIPPRPPTDPIREQPPTDTARCPLLIPGTDIRCSLHRHDEAAACTSTGVRDGVHYHAVFWRTGR